MRIGAIPPGGPLDRDFFASETLHVARALLGCRLRFRGCEGIIVETEGYKTDAASHFQTRRLKGRALVETWGHVYVYLNYGMYHLLNFTTERHGVGAVLIRAVRPTSGIERMKRRRGVDDPFALADGPGKICVAFGIDMRQDGRPVGEEIEVLQRETEPDIVSGPRIGIRRDAHLPWRYLIAGSPWVSGVTKRMRREHRA